MARPMIEFLQSQKLDWVAADGLFARPGATIKLLSEDDETGASTMLIHYPAGWRIAGPEWCDVDEEFFVLRGRVEVNGQIYGPHHYAYWPRGFVRSDLAAGSDGATLILCQAGRATYRTDIGQAPPVDPALLSERVDSFVLPWDRTNMDPNIAHLNAWRKNLRVAPDGSGRTYLLAGLPQGFPASGTEPLERHPHVEEMFMIAGDMPCSLGIMRAGAYFWRPPMIWHGADCTLNGFLLFARTPGSNQTISDWDTKGHPVTLTPEHRPVVPASLRHAATPLDDPVTY